MSLTITQAVDEIYGLFHATWDTDGDTNLYPVHYEGREFEVPEGQDASGNPLAWVRLLIRFPSMEKATVGNTAGQSRYRRNGFISINIFTPLGIGGGLRDLLLQKVLDIFEGQRTAGGVFFRGTTSPTNGPDGSWFQQNITFLFEFDQIK